MRKSLFLLAVLTLPLAGCMDDPASRGLGGAAAGAILGGATDNKFASLLVQKFGHYVSLLTHVVIGS